MINRAILIPLVSAITGFIKDSTGYVVPNEYADLAVNLLLYLIIPIIGALMHPKKQSTEENTLTAEEKMYH